MESLSKPPSRVERDASGGKKPQLWMHFFPSYRWKLAVTEPLLYNVFFFLRDKFDPKFKKDTPALLL